MEIDTNFKSKKTIITYTDEDLTNMEDLKEAVLEAVERQISKLVTYHQ